MGPQRLRQHRQVPAVPADCQRGRRHCRVPRSLRHSGITAAAAASYRYHCSSRSLIQVSLQQPQPHTGITAAAAASYRYHCSSRSLIQVSLQPQSHTGVCSCSFIQSQSFIAPVVASSSLEQVRRLADTNTHTHTAV